MGGRASVRVFRRWGIIAIWFGFGLEKKTTESNNAEIAFVICENCAFLARFSLVLSASVSFSYNFWTDTSAHIHSFTSVKFRFLKTRIAIRHTFFLPHPSSSSFFRFSVSFSASFVGADEIFILILRFIVQFSDRDRVIFELAEQHQAAARFRLLEWHLVIEVATYAAMHSSYVRFVNTNTV